MHKKKILIINKSFEIGGIQMALANMLKEIHNRYDVTLAVFNCHGPLLDRVPEDVKLLKISSMAQVLGMNSEDCKKYGSLSQRIFKTVGSVWSKVFGNTLPVAFALALQRNVGDYDAVISYHQETSAKTLVSGFGKFALKKCTAAKKIAWVHADFLATKLATRKNLKTYKKFDKIVGVSKTTINNFITAYPELKNKCDYCYNCVPAREITEKSNLEHNVFNKSENDTVLFSACRLVKEKGLVPALENLLSVFKENKNLKWYIAGTGPEGEKLEELIAEKHLEDQVFLIGFKNNPYPYIREADYLFLPSLHETFSMVVSEAHILGTSVIASDIPIMREVLNENDFLCADSSYALCNFFNDNKKNIKHNIINTYSPQWLNMFENIVGETIET